MFCVGLQEKMTLEKSCENRGYLRNRLDVGINDSVEIRKVQSKSAEKVTLAPTEPLRIVGAEGYLQEYLLGSLLSTGDIFL